MKANKENKEIKMKIVRLELCEGDHAALRIAAAKSGEPMSQYVRKIVQKNLAKMQNRC